MQLSAKIGGLLSSATQLRITSAVLMRTRFVQTEMLCNLGTQMCRDAEDNFYDRTEGVQRQKRAAESEALDAATLLGQKVHCPKGSPYYAVMPSAVLCCGLLLYCMLYFLLSCHLATAVMEWAGTGDGMEGEEKGWGGVGWDGIPGHVPGMLYMDATIHISLTGNSVCRVLLHRHSINHASGFTQTAQLDCVTRLLMSLCAGGSASREVSLTACAG